MAAAPGWSFEVTPAVRTVLTWGLPTAAADRIGPLDDGTWARFRAEIDRHRLAGLLVATVADGSLAVTDRQDEEVAQLEVNLTVVRMWQEPRFTEIVDRLTGAGLPIRMLKGAAFASLDYPDPQMRPTSDLDLLVRGEDIEAAAACLIDDGAARLDPDPTPGYAATVGKGATLTMPDGLEVDLHRTLVWGPFGVRICAEDLWTRSRPFRYGGSAMVAMELETSLLHACYHLLVMGFRRALSARDVAQMLRNPDLDADRVLWLARRWTGEAVLAASVLLAVEELDLELDSILIDWARGFAPRLRDRLWMRVERPETQIGPLEPVVTYQALRTAAERRVLRRATVAPTEGTWPSPGDRARRVRRRVRDVVPLGRT